MIRYIARYQNITISSLLLKFREHEKDKKDTLVLKNLAYQTRLIALASCFFNGGLVCLLLVGYDIIQILACYGVVLPQLCYCFPLLLLDEMR